MQKLPFLPLQIWVSAGLLITAFSCRNGVSNQVPAPTSAVSPGPVPLPSPTPVSLGLPTYHLLNTGNSASGLFLGATKGTQTGFQPTLVPGTPTPVEADLVKLNGAGTVTVVLASCQKDVSVSAGGGNHPTTFTFNFPVTGFSGDLLGLRLTELSGGQTTVILNSNDFDSHLTFGSGTGPASSPVPISTQAASPTPLPLATPPLVSPAMSIPAIQAQVDAIYNQQIANQFGPQRYALLFTPGTYPGLPINVGFFNNGSTVQVSGDWFQSGGNFMWAVSQACPLRRVDVDNDLYLFEVGPNGAGEFASGGFLAGSQQQFFTRNTAMGNWATGVWTMVFVGDPGAPAVGEKPFLYEDSSGNFEVFVPATRINASGPGWTSGTAPGTSLGLNTFYIARPAADTAETLNALDQPLNVTKADTVFLGLGIATLQPSSGTAAMTVADVDGVLVAGQTGAAVTVNSSHVIGDDLWNGNGGQTYFYQSELPYDPQSQAQWTSVWGSTRHNGWASYKVADTVTSHQVFGLGVYAVFINAVEVPTGAPGVNFTDLMDLSITSLRGIDHVVNSIGPAASPGNFGTYPYLVNYP